MKLQLLVAALPLLASGCAATSPRDVVAADDPSASLAQASPLSYDSPLSGYTHRRPVDPKAWRSQNDAQAPQGDAP